jgi:hypothetical protein
MTGRNGKLWRKGSDPRARLFSVQIESKLPRRDAPAPQLHFPLPPLGTRFRDGERGSAESNRGHSRNVAKGRVPQMSPSSEPQVDTSRLSCSTMLVIPRVRTSNFPRARPRSIFGPTPSLLTVLSGNRKFGGIFSSALAVRGRFHSTPQRGQIHIKRKLQWRDRFPAHSDWNSGRSIPILRPFGWGVEAPTANHFRGAMLSRPPKDLSTSGFRP